MNTLSTIVIIVPIVSKITQFILYMEDMLYIKYIYNMLYIKYIYLNNINKIVFNFILF